MIITHSKPTIGGEEIKAAIDALTNVELTVGTKVKEFEHAFFNYIGINSVATSSGTSALHLALIALGVSENDEVILPAYTCVSVVYPVLYQQARPILADVSDDYNISIGEIQKRITAKTKAIIMPHMFGYPADINEIKELCEAHELALIEDCAQSIGALYDHKKVGTFGDISIFSFNATKMMTSIQGGMVCTNNPDWIQTFKDLRYHDQIRSCEDSDLRLKYSYRMSDVEAAVGIVQLNKLDYFIKRRRAIASIYREKLSDAVIQPPESVKKVHIYSRYVIKTPFRSLPVIERMREQNIRCEIMHLPPLSRRALLRKYNRDAEFSKTEELINFSVSLPIYPSLEEGAAEHITDVFNKTVKGTA